MYSKSDHTFVICGYKENPYIEETIRSIQDQTVLGNVLLSTSTPNSYLKHLCDQYGLQMAVNPQPSSLGGDWNFGYDSAETPLVTLAHQDDRYEANYLERMLSTVNDYHMRQQQVSLLFSDYYEIRNDHVIAANRILKVKRAMNAILKHPMFNKSVFVKKRVLSLGCSICCPSVTFVKPMLGTSIFDTKLKNSCDYLAWVTYASKPGSFVYLPEKLLGHRIYEESATTANLSDNIRRGEDERILSMLWPTSIARMINSVYVKSEKSNQL